MKLKRMLLGMICCLIATSAFFFAACGGEAPFARRFTGVVGSFDEAGNLAATLLFPESEQAEGRINLTDRPELNIEFRYTVSEKGKITFEFDGEDRAEGTLHGKDISVTAHVWGQEIKFSGTFYLLSEKVDGEVTEEGYVVAGHPLSDVVTYPEETKSVMLNGKELTIEELLRTRMPAQDTTIEITTQGEA